MPQADNACTTTHALFASPAGSEPTMSSREIAELTGKRHDHVMRDIRVMLVELHGEADLPKFGGVYRGGNGEDRPCFNLPRHETLVLVSGYSIQIRSRIIARWDELERQVRQPVDLMKALDDPAFLRQALASKNDEVEKLRAITQELAPKAIALDRLETATDGSMCITDAAKVLQIRPKELFQYLQSHNWIYARVGTQGYMAYQARLVSGHLEHKVTTVDRADGSEKVTHQVRVTAKGLAALSKLLPPLLMAVAR